MLPRPISADPLVLYRTLGLLIDQLETALAASGSSPLTTKGDIYTHDATLNARLAVGIDTTVLTADAAQPTGIKWAAPAGGPPTGAAGGDLAGTYPNPTVKASVGLTGVPTSATAAVDTNTTQIATTAFVLGQAAAAAPLMDGIAAVGVSTRYARADHVHPTDTSRRASNDFTGEHDPGNLTVATECFLIELGRLNLTGTETLTLAGTAELVLADLGPYAPTKITLGTPRVPVLPFTVATDYFLEVRDQFSLVGSQNVTLEGTAELILTDDFKTRTSLVLAGVG